MQGVRHVPDVLEHQVRVLLMDSTAVPSVVILKYGISVGAVAVITWNLVIRSPVSFFPADVLHPVRGFRRI